MVVWLWVVLPLPSLLVVNDAVLVTVPDGHGAVDASVPETMWTKTLAPAARSEERRVGKEWGIKQLWAVVSAAMLQDRPELVGTVSVMVTPWARPGPSLVAVIV